MLRKRMTNFIAMIEPISNIGAFHLATATSYVMVVYKLYALFCNDFV
jgi:hypothetical protein